MKASLWRKARQGAFVLLLVSLFFQASPPPAAQAATPSLPAIPSSGVPYNTGDVFVSVNVFSGDPIFQVQPSTGAVLNTLNTSNGSPAGGLCFDAAGFLYAADSSGRVSQFDSLGNLVNPAFINIPNYSFSSCLVDTAQHVWVTVAGATNAPNAPTLLEYDGAGRSLLPLTWQSNSALSIRLLWRPTSVPSSTPPATTACNALTCAAIPNCRILRLA